MILIKGANEGSAGYAYIKSNGRYFLSFFSSARYSFPGSLISGLYCPFSGLIIPQPIHILNSGKALHISSMCSSFAFCFPNLMLFQVSLSILVASPNLLGMPRMARMLLIRVPIVINFKNLIVLNTIFAIIFYCK